MKLKKVCVGSNGFCVLFAMKMGISNFQFGEDRIAAIRIAFFEGSESFQGIVIVFLLEVFHSLFSQLFCSVSLFSPKKASTSSQSSNEQEKKQQKCSEGKLLIPLYHLSLLEDLAHTFRKKRPRPQTPVERDSASFSV